jgi:hypothetical protein
LLTNDPVAGLREHPKSKVPSTCWAHAHCAAPILTD